MTVPARTKPALEQELSYVVLSPRDIASVTQMHIAAFPHSLLTRLGADVVARNYESLMTLQPEVVGLGAQLNGRTVGFAFGGVFRAELTTFVRPNGVFLVRRLLSRPWLALDANVRQRMAVGLLALFGIVRPRASGIRVPPCGEYFGIQAIAVDPDMQGRGIGRELMAAMETNARARGFNRMLLTVHPSNTQARAFYERTGWQPMTAPDGTWDGILLKLL